MPRPLVEEVGAPWHCGSLQRRFLFIGTRNGLVRVGNGVFTWEFVAAPFGVLVGERDRSGERDRVRILATDLPSGGLRWWFACPGCGRRCDLLYAVGGAARLACRSCCRLAYASQRKRKTGTARTRRTRSTLTFTKEVKHRLLWGRVPHKQTTITLTDSSDAEGRL